jgi:hypothetical protein
MTLSLAKCGTLGGDVEMIPTVKLLAERHPDVDFYLIGRNTGERPADVGLPPNVYNPWIQWQPQVRAAINRYGLNHPNLAVDEHRKVTALLRDVTDELFRELDGMVMWLGQHGTTNTPLPTIRDRSQLTKPYDWSTLYGSYLLQGINAWRDVDPLRREEVLLNADPRNYVKYRDSKWPWRHPVLAQFTTVNNVKHERYGEARSFERWCVESGEEVSCGAAPGAEAEVWLSKLRSVYSRLEVNGLAPGTPFGDLVSYRDDNFEDRAHFGLFINEARRQVNPRLTRAAALEEWVLPLKPAFIHGTWSRESQTKLGVEIEPAPWSDYYPKLHSVKCTFTTPSSGSGWATTKPWEAFAAGTVCLFHKDYDVQDNILSDAPVELRQFLRVSDVDQLRARVNVLTMDKTYWLHIIKLQREHFDRALAEMRWLKMIEERLGL